MKVGIIGAGSIGLLIASYLGQSHHVQLFVRRKEQAELLKEKHIQRYQHAHYIDTVKAEYSHEDIPSQADCCLICVKQNNMQHIMPMINQLPKEMPLIFVQNGMGHLQALQQLKRPTAIGIVEHGAKKLSDYQVNHLGNGKITLAPIELPIDALIEITEELNQEAFPFTYTEEAMPLIKQKLLVNSVINPLTALFQVENGAILENGHLKELAMELCNEAAFVLQIDQQEAWKKIAAVAANTKRNTSSMLQDVLAKKPTEIDAISGYLLSVSSTELPYTRFIHKAILAVEGKE